MAVAAVPVVISVATIVLVAACYLLVSRLLSRDHRADRQPPPGSVPPGYSPAARAPIVPFYRIALIGVVLQAAFVLLVPWAAGFRDLVDAGAAALAVAAFFVLLLLSGLAYAMRRRALDWHEDDPGTVDDG